MRILINERKEYKKIMNGVIFNEICITPQAPPAGFAAGEHIFAEKYSEWCLKAALEDTVKNLTRFKK